MDGPVAELSQKVIETLNLETVAARDIDAHTHLAGRDLGSDYIDVLERVMLIERDCGQTIENRGAVRNGVGFGPGPHRFRRVR